MPIDPRPRAQGYIKGMQGVDLHLSVDPDEHYISTETGRPTIPTKTVDLEQLKKYIKTFARPIYMSDVVPVGQVVIVDHGALPYHHGAYLHPTDYYWVKHRDNPKLAHKLVMSWMDQRLEAMVRAAEAKLDAMVEEMELRDAYLATMDRYADQRKWYHDTFGESGIVFVPWDEDDEELVSGAALGNRLHNRFAGFADDGSQFHPHTIEPKTSSIFNPKNGAV